jgi:hypothetical protein
MGAPLANAKGAVPGLISISGLGPRHMIGLGSRRAGVAPSVGRGVTLRAEELLRALRGLTPLASTVTIGTCGRRLGPMVCPLSIVPCAVGLGRVKRVVSRKAVCLCVGAMLQRTGSKG